MISQQKEGIKLVLELLLPSRPVMLMDFSGIVSYRSYGKAFVGFDQIEATFLGKFD